MDFPDSFVYTDEYNTNECNVSVVNWLTYQSYTGYVNMLQAYMYMHIGLKTTLQCLFPDLRHERYMLRSTFCFSVFGN